MGDYHGQARSTDPNARHHLSKYRMFLLKKQYLISYVGLIHNHPSGDPTPSRADIEMTRQIIDVARPLGIAVHDHVIIGRNGHASLRGLQLI